MEPGVGEPVWTDLERPRELTEAERGLLEYLATAACPALVAQVAAARVRGTCRCGCPSVRLITPGPVIPAAQVRALSTAGRDDYLGVTASGGTAGHEGVAVTLHVVRGLAEELEVYTGDGVAGDLPPTVWLGLPDLMT